MRSYDVLLSGVRVGQLAETSDGRVAFRFFDDYKRLPRRPVLSQSFEDDLDRTYVAKRGMLPAFFANLIPEGQLRAIIEASLGIAPGDGLGLLAAVSVDLPGAVEIVSSDMTIDVQLNGDENGTEVDLHVASKPDTRDPGVELRFSLAGVQMKFSLIRQNEKLTLPGRNARGDVIVKVDSAQYMGVAQNELATLEWARAAGFDVPRTELSTPDALPEPLRKYAPAGGSILIIDRYDRDGQRRIHQEDFAQVAGVQPARKYEHLTYDQCAALVRNIVGAEGYDEFIARLTFVIASGNADAHLKNWSLVYKNAITPTLSPMYDQVATVAWPSVSFELPLKLADTWDFLHVDEQTFGRLAKRAGADPRTTIATVERTVERIVEGWRSARVSDALPPSHAAALRSYWLRAPLFQRFALAM